MIARITASLAVRDFDRSIDFYVHELKLFTIGGQRYYGIDEGRLARMKAQDNVFLRAVGNSSCELILRLASSPESVPTLGSEQALKLEVDHVAAVLGRLEGGSLPSGAALARDLVETPFGEMFWVSDPSGNLIQVISTEAPELQDGYAMRRRVGGGKP